MSARGGPRRRRRVAPQDASVVATVTARATSSDVSVYGDNCPTPSGDGGGDRLWQHSKTMISSDPAHLGRPLTKTTSNLVALEAFADPVALGSSSNDVLPLIHVYVFHDYVYAYYLHYLYILLRIFMMMNTTSLTWLRFFMVTTWIHAHLLWGCQT
jgi:hypothetical protein